ncbi:MAG: D-alanyl-D-alanine carboxypeptidase [Clostridium sp.]|nr:D-alanyl-D-alanine carboxypeptidase [Acetatifactor muris]MCM1527534.1 D-alanyl-D-alanine carboxypeptidase [Bacteroides sp.]MCM1563776.1 D-alanyl-D-alanine carboxypeptidase [Clostridium sp.]
MNRKNSSSIRIRIMAALCAVCVSVSSAGMSALAAPAVTIREQNIAVNQAIPVESNEVANWPTGPIVSAESAILMELETGVILYEKNIHAKEYPASTTKILTTLIASEKCTLDETVYFSHDAVYGIPVGSNHVAMNEGDTLTMEKCLQAILIRSANEVSYAVAEHIGGTWDGFAEIMNERAAELGCVDSHFVNPNGLPDEDHYTSAYDLAMIGRAFFSNEMLCQMTLMPLLRLTKKNGELVDANQMDLLPGKKYAYDYLVGCKTGYTNDARSCLVSCAEKDGMKLICVVLKDESPNHYEDTIALFNYGFNNFEKANISQVETKYNIENTGFYSDNDIFGNSKPILTLNRDDCVILPKTVTFEDLDSEISYSTENPNQVAVIHYSYHNVPIGSVSVDLATDEKGTYSFDPIESPEEQEEKSERNAVIFINVLKVLMWAAGIAAAVLLVLFIIRSYKSYRTRHPNGRRNWKRERRKQRSYNPTRQKPIMSWKKQSIRQAKQRQKKSGPTFRSSRRNRKPKS